MPPAAAAEFPHVSLWQGLGRLNYPPETAYLAESPHSFLVNKIVLDGAIRASYPPGGTMDRPQKTVWPMEAYIGIGTPRFVIFPGNTVSEL